MTTLTDTVNLLSENSDWIRRLARSLVRDPDTADDIAQETAVEALRASQRGNGDLNRGWLAGVVRNLVKNRYRRDARQSARENASPPRGPEPAAADAAAQVEQQRRLADAVLSLDEPFRDVLLLRFYEDRPPREIAKRLDIPIATVRSRIGRGLQKLRGQLDAQHDGDRSAWMAALTPLATAPLRDAAGTLGFWSAKKKAAGLAAATLLAGTAAFMNWDNATGEGAGLSAAPQPVSSVGDADDSSETSTEDNAKTAMRADVSRTVPTLTEAPYLRFVDALTKEPVTDAKVYVTDTAKTGLDAYLIDGLHSPLAQVQERGTLHGLDADGRLSSARLPKYGRILARSETHMAWTITRSDPGEESIREVELWPIRSLEIEVKDRHGNPLSSLPVSIQAKSFREHYAMLLAATAQNGTASMEWFEGLGSASSTGARARLRAGLAVPGAEHITKPLAPNVTSAALRCPPLGSARVGVTQRGRPVEDGTLVFLGGRTELLSPHSHPTARTQNGVAEFPFVAVGAELSVGASIHPKIHWFTEDADGPRAEGSTAKIDFDIAEDVVHVTGRIVDAQGDARRNEAFFCTNMVGKLGERRPSHFETDASGSFSVYITGNRSTDLRLQFNDKALLNTDGAQTKVPAVDTEDAGKPIDLQSITLPRPLLLAKGRLCDEEGTPLQWAGIHCTSNDGSSSRDTVIAGGITTDENGRFKLVNDGRGAEHPLTLRINIHNQPDLVVEPIPITPGGPALEVVARRMLAIKGSLRAPPGVDLEQIILVLRRPHDVPVDVAIENTSTTAATIGLRSTSSTSRVSAKINNAVARATGRDQGQFTLSPVPAGSYTLQIQANDGSTLLSIDNVVAAPGVQDPRLQDIDLGALLGCVTFHTQDADGRPVQAAAFGLRANGSTVDLGFTGSPMLYDKQKIQTIVVVAKRRFFVDVGKPEGETTVTMPEGLPVPLRLTGVSDAPEPYAIRLVVARADKSAKTPADAGRSYRPDRQPDHLRMPRGGVATARVREAGRYVVHAYVTRARRRLPAEEIVLQPAATVEVRAGARPSRLNVDIDPTALDAAIARLKQRLDKKPQTTTGR